MNANTSWIIFLFVIWFVFGSFANVYCKNFLIKEGSPIILTLGQYCMGIMITSIVLLLGNPSGKDIIPKSLPVDSKTKINNVGISQLFTLNDKSRKLVFFVCILNGMGHLMTNWSMNAVAVSFTHTIKAAEPIFTVILSVVALNESVSRTMYLSLIPITIGIILATTTELSYTHTGLFAAMMSNLLFSTRNIYSKQLQNNQFSSWILFWILSVSGALLMSFIFIFATILRIDISFPIESALSSLFLASFFHAIYNLVSFMILARVASLTHSIGNAMRRVFIIYFSVIWFHTPLSILNILGTLLACFGVLLYANASHQNSRYQKRTKDYLDL